MMFADALERVAPLYQIPNQDLVGEVLVPAMRVSDEVKIEAGFFSSRCLAQVAPGLAAFINDTKGVLHVLASPEISEDDREAIRGGLRSPQDVLEETMVKLFEEARLSDSAVERHAVDTLAYLVASNRLEIRVVLMDQGMYHRKIWLFRSGDHWVAVHGSGNATERGLLVNGEQMSVDRTWEDGKRSAQRVALFQQQWSERWNNQNPRSITVEINQVLELLRRHARLIPPTASDFWDAWRRDYEDGLEPILPPGYETAPTFRKLQIPDDLIWREGRFAHQGLAVDAVVDSGGGILSIATGGGKTKTALIACTEIQNRDVSHLCVVVLVPSLPLANQWASDIQDFGIDPVVLTGSVDRAARREELQRLSIAFGTAEPRTEVLLVTNALFSAGESMERAWLEALPDSVACILIADEVHHLGAKTFIDNLPDFFEYRIGLSATPVRQYDPDGTDQLFDFFGGAPVFDFSLKDAIDAGCLVPYHYFIHEVQFSPDEMDLYEELTEQLVRAGFRVDDNGVTVGLSQRVERLLQRRRALVEQADLKIDALERALTQSNPQSIAKTLVYASAKPTVEGKTRQITAVNRLLQDLHVNSHQYTGEETRTSKSSSFLEKFEYGDYQVLTAMRVLDEGVDIPETGTAFLLASSTVEREWIQRRGRILRNSPSKQFANLHDFLVVPPDTGSPSGSSLLSSELRRARSFSQLAENEFDPDGPNAVIRRLESQVWRV